VISSLDGRAFDLFSAVGVVFNLLGIIAIVGIVGSLLGIVLAYAQRAVVLEDTGVITAVRTGAGLVRQRIGTSLVLWLIALALSIGGGIALLIGLFISALPGLLIGLIFGAIAGAAGGNMLAVTLSGAGVVLFVALFIGSAALNTFIWHYWTVAYLRLTTAAAAAATVVPPAPVPAPEPT